MIPHPDDTIVALSSAPGAGRRAIVRITGPKTWHVVQQVFRASSHPDRQPAVPTQRAFFRGAVHLSDVHSPLPADLFFWPAPRTYTGQNLAELHTISSPPLIERLIADLLTKGARAAQPGEFTLRAFLAGKKDLTQAEAVLAVIEARSDSDLKKALNQMAGGVAHPLAKLREELLNLLADIEAGLDFVDEDIEFVDKSTMLMRIISGIAHLTNVRRQLDDRSVSGRAIRVAIVGPPNAGKSSLFNALSGSPAALVSDTAGTTRDYLTHTLDLNGITLQLIDTAGWQHASDTIEEQAQRLGSDQTERADIVLWCVPAGDATNPRDEERLQRTGAQVLRVWTKADLIKAPLRMILEQTIGTRESCLVSVVAPGGMDSLRRMLSDVVSTLVRPPLAPSQSRCRGHVEVAIQALRRAHEHVMEDDPQELLALALRESLEQIGEMAGAVYTNDLLDRIFSRFCIGK